MRLAFEVEAWEHFLYWQETDKAVFRKLTSLLKECQRHPFEGTGKPEPLKGELAGYWSRRITLEHRLVYRVRSDAIESSPAASTTAPEVPPMPSFLSRLFGSSSTPAASKAEAVLHKDCRIYPEPVREGGGYRVTARIEKDFGDQVKTHLLIRADTYGDPDEAKEASLNKAKQAIDQLGNELFRDPD